MSDEDMAIIIGKTPSGVRDQRAKLGLNRFAGDSSYEGLPDFIRRNNIEWKRKSMQHCHYRCLVSGERFEAIHHLYGLNLILQETLNYLSLPMLRKVDDYSKEELKTILRSFRDVQSNYPLGICLKNDIHQQFHLIYGYGNNTTQQWNMFMLKHYN